MPRTRFGTFEELIADYPEAVRQLASAAKELVLSIHPDATEVVRLGDRAATYGLGPKKMSEAYAYVIPQQEYVNLGLYYGARLPDLDGLLEGTGRNMRHVKVRSLDDLERARSLIEAAVSERRHALDGSVT